MKATALSNLQKLFHGYPIKSTEKNLLKMETIRNLKGTDRDDAFSNLVSALNPFSKFLLEDCHETSKCWELDEKILPVENKE